ncbi:beta-lactamase hydrolase domain-containing protein [Stutzerimonas nitrititolerans]|uniref:beta-lactamase hydrolase domain-containing protein n=1 Tax=Stutzerimonas nitrititolerans TaxID=2482751 RepID=UPI0028AB6F00|nr:sulfur transferase domain-containing protein [Stutzerimonas nitrititolerans]
MDIPIVRHDDAFATTGQLCLHDLDRVVAAGFRSILCNRPDGEGGAEQPGSEALSVRAEQLGLAFAYLPIPSVDVGEDEVRAFASVLELLPKPVLAFCRTGRRSSRLHERYLADFTSYAAPRAQESAC